MLFVIVLTLSGSRSVWIYISGVLALAVVAYGKTRDPIHHRLAIYSGLLLALFIATQFLAPLTDNWLDLNSRTALQRGISDAVHPRLMEWYKIWFIFLQSPITGIGMGHFAWHSFTLGSLPVFANVSSNLVFGHSHNLFIQVLAELGLIGLALLLLLIIGWLRQFSYNWLKPENWLTAGVLLVVFIHSNLEYPLWYSNFLGIAAVFLGLGDERTTRVAFTPRLGQIATASSFALIFVILAMTYGSFRKLTNVNALILESSPQEAATRLWAISKNPLLTPWAEAALVAHTTPDRDRDRLAQQLEVVGRTMHHNPNPIRVNRYILYSALAGRTEDSMVAMRQVAGTYKDSFILFACFLREQQDEHIRPLLAETDHILASSNYRQAVPALNTMCRDTPSLITAEWLHYTTILGR